MEPPRLKFLHLADVHLDRPPGRNGLRLPFDKKEARLRESREIFIRAMDLAIQEHVEIILIAGDLWDEVFLDQKTVAFVLESLAAVKLPVIIAPGNRDSYHVASHYSNVITRARANISWPTNVLVFTAPEFTHAIPQGLDFVSITGCACLKGESVARRIFAKQLSPPKRPLKLALVHASRESTLPRGKTSVHPFTDQELLAQPFDYVALGHYHNLSTIADPSGRIRASYPGATCALGLFDRGPRGIVIGTLEPGGVKSDNFEFHELDTRRVVRVEVDVTGCRQIQQVEKTVLDVLRNADIRSSDMVIVDLNGVYPGGNYIPFGDKFLQDAYFHLQINTARVRPEWSLEYEDETKALTTESIFRQRMKDMMKMAADQGKTKDLQHLQNALYYGLDALYGSTITPRKD